MHRLAPPLLLTLGLAVGCAPPPNDGTRRVTLDELKKETQHLPFFSYTGGNEGFYHFTTDEGQHYKIQRKEWAGAPPCPLVNGEAIYVTFRGNCLVPAAAATVEGRWRGDLAP